MYRIIFAGLAIAALNDAALAMPMHDRRLDEAAARIVATKMGEIRGAFDLGRRPELVAPIERPQPVRSGAIVGTWNNGLAIADGKRVIPLHSF